MSSLCTLRYMSPIIRFMQVPVRDRRRGSLSLCYRLSRLAELRSGGDVHQATVRVTPGAGGLVKVVEERRHMVEEPEDDGSVTFAAMRRQVSVRSTGAQWEARPSLAQLQLT